AARDLDSRAEDASASGVVRAFLRPVDLVALVVEGDADAPLGQVAAIVIGRSGLHERLDARTVQVGPHHAHALAVAPVEPAMGLVELELLGRVGSAFGDDRLAIAPIKVR